MKDTDIHNGLQNKEVRDVLSKIIVDFSITKNPEYNPNLKGLDAQIDWAEKNIEYWKKEKEKIEHFQAVKKISDLYKWEEFDVSNFVEKTEKLYRNFFGSKSEYLDLCKKLSVEPEY